MKALNLVNAAIGRHLANMFPGHYQHTNTKHDHFKDFGYPENLTFEHYFNMYRRNGLANSAVERIKSRTWQGESYLLEQERDGSQKKGKVKETVLEKQIRVAFRNIRFWHRLAEADRRAMISGYSGILLRFGDGGEWDTPVGKVAGLEKVIGMEVVWSKQLEVAEWYMDLTGPDKDKYGTPKMFQFNEVPMKHEDAAKNPTQRTVKIHPDRVFIWSTDGTILGESLLSPGFNDLIDIEKVKGGGGEGFWKNAKASPVLTTEDATTSFAEMAKAMNTTTEDLHSKMNDQVANFNAGFDQMLMLQGMKAETLNITMPSPEHFLNGPLQSFAASVKMPLKVLVGNQTGERASSEDAEDWDQTIMARRSEQTHPLIYDMVKKFVALGVLPEKDEWYIEQPDLTEAKTSEKMERATKMSAINVQSSTALGMATFTTEEIRAVADYEPISPTLLATPEEEDETDETADKGKPNDNPRKN